MCCLGESISLFGKNLVYKKFRAVEDRKSAREILEERFQPKYHHERHHKRLAIMKYDRKDIRAR